MKVKIRNVTPGEVDESATPPIILTYRCELMLGNQQEIFLHKIDYDLRPFIGKGADFLIYAEKSIRKKPFYKISGKFIRKYKVEQEKIENYVMPEFLVRAGITREHRFKKYKEGIPVILTESSIVFSAVFYKFLSFTCASPTINSPQILDQVGIDLISSQI